MHKRNTKYALIAVGALLLFLVAWMVLANAAAKRAWLAVKEDLEAKGARLKIAEIYHAPSAEQSNGGRQFLDALDLLPDFDRRLVGASMQGAGPGRALRLSQLTNWPAELADKSWVDDVWELIPPTVDPIRHGLDQALSAATNDVLFFDLPFQEKHVGVLLRHLAPVRKLVHLATAAVLYDLRQGDHSAARLQLMQSVSFLVAFDEPHLISQFVRYAALHSATAAMWEALAVVDWRDEELAELQAAWEEVDLAGPMLQALEMERAVGLRFWEELLHDPEAWDQVGLGSSTGGPVESLIGAIGNGDSDEIVYEARGLVWPIATAYADAAFFAETMQTNLSMFQSRVAGRSFAAALKYPMDVPDSFHFSGMFLPGMENVGRRVAQVEVVRWLTVTAIALKRFEIVHGRLPERLEDLVPRFLKSVPVDWYDGKPLRYERGPGGTFKLWSIGKDGIDDGAATFDPKKSWDSDRDIYWPQPATPAEVEDQRRELELKKAAAPRP